MKKLVTKLLITATTLMMLTSSPIPSGASPEGSNTKPAAPTASASTPTPAPTWSYSSADFNFNIPAEWKRLSSEELKGLSTTEGANVLAVYKIDKTKPFPYMVLTSTPTTETVIARALPSSSEELGKSAEMNLAASMSAYTITLENSSINHNQNYSVSITSLAPKAPSDTTPTLQAVTLSRIHAGKLIRSTFVSDPKDFNTSLKALNDLVSSFQAVSKTEPAKGEAPTVALEAQSTSFNSGVVYGIVAVLALAVVFYVIRRRRHRDDEDYDRDRDFD